jgi:hypothetical protein
MRVVADGCLEFGFREDKPSGKERGGGGGEGRGGKRWMGWWGEKVSVFYCLVDCCVKTFGLVVVGYHAEHCEAHAAVCCCMAVSKVWM